MPTKNPRLSVVLSPPVAETLAALSKETGESASSLVRGLLDQAQPALVRMLQLIRAANQAKGQIGAGVGASLDRVVTDLQAALSLADEHFDRALDDLADQAQAVKGRRRAQPVAAPSLTPAPVTRGSGTPERATKAKEKEGVQTSKVAVEGGRRGRL